MCRLERCHDVALMGGRTRVAPSLVLLFAAGGLISSVPEARAHGTITPAEAPTGTTQRFEIQVPNTSVNVAITGFRLTAPAGVDVRVVDAQGWSTMVGGLDARNHHAGRARRNGVLSSARPPTGGSRLGPYDVSRFTGNRNACRSQRAISQPFVRVNFAATVSPRYRPSTSATAGPP